MKNPSNPQKKINWDIFRANYADNPQQAFEWLAYLIFCDVHKQSFGINRYLNQAYRESEAITVDGKRVAFQAKFYDGQLGSRAHVTELQKCIIGNASDHIDRLILFTNLSWGQTSKGGASRAKQTLETLAEHYHIQLEWFTASRIEIAVAENDFLQSFFTLHHGAKEAYRARRARTAAWLKQAKPYPSLQGNELIYPRDTCRQQLNEAASLWVLLYGESGVGKSRFIKECIDHSEHPETEFYFDAAEFVGIRSLDELFPTCTARDFFNYVNHAGGPKRLYIDTAEKWPDGDELINTHLIELQQYLEGNNWKVIITLHGSALQAFDDRLLNIGGSTVINLPPIPASRLSAWAETYSFALPASKDFAALLCRPFFLYEFLQFSESERPATGSDFWKAMWKNITNHSPAAEAVLRRIAVEHIRSKTPYLNTEAYTEEALRLLRRDVLVKEGFYYRFSYDFYVEVALYMAIDKHLIQEGKTLSKALSEYPNTACMRRAVVQYVQNNQHTIDIPWDDCFSLALREQECGSLHDAVFIALITSSGFKRYLEENSFDLLCDNNARLLYLIRLITRYSVSPYEGNMKEEKPKHLTLSWVCHGEEWPTMLDYLLQHVDSLQLTTVKQVIAFCVYLCASVSKGVFPERVCSDLSYRLSSLALRCCGSPLLGSAASKGNRLSGEQTGLLFDIISFDLKSNEDELSEAFRQCISASEFPPLYDKLFLNAISNERYFSRWAQELPELQRRLLDYFWLKHEETETVPAYHANSRFGLSSLSFHYPLAGARLTPIDDLLHSDFEPTLDFLLSFIDKCVLAYEKNTNSETKTYRLPWQTENAYDSYLVVSQELWDTYRGFSRSSSPPLLQCCHMALEKVLLEKAAEAAAGRIPHQSVFCRLLHRILDQTHSVSVVAVVAAVCTAEPEMCCSVSLRLLRMKDFYLADKHRRRQELPLFLVSHIDDYDTPHLQMCFRERFEALRAPFRHTDLRDLARLYLQSHQDIPEIEACIQGMCDASANSFESAEPLTQDEIRNRLFFIIYHLQKNDIADPVPASLAEQIFSFEHFEKDMQSENDSAIIPNTDNVYILLYLIVFHRDETAWYQQEVILFYILRQFDRINEILDSNHSIFLFLQHLNAMRICFPDKEEHLILKAAQYIRKYDFSSTNHQWRLSLYHLFVENKALAKRVLLCYLSLSAGISVSEENYTHILKREAYNKRDLYHLICILPEKTQSDFIFNLLLIASVGMMPPEEEKMYALADSYIQHLRYTTSEKAQDLLQIILKSGGSRFNLLIVKFLLSKETEVGCFWALWDTIAREALCLSRNHSSADSAYISHLLSFLFFNSRNGEKEPALFLAEAEKRDSMIRKLIRISDNLTYSIWPLCDLIVQAECFRLPYTEWVVELLERHLNDIPQMKDSVILHQVGIICEHYYYAKRAETPRRHFPVITAILEALFQAGNQQAGLLIGHKL